MMEMANRPGIRIVKNEPSEFAAAFSKLYCNIIPKLYNIKSRDFLNDVKKELKKLRTLKYFIDEGPLTSKEREFAKSIKYEDIAVRCAYMYSYSVLNTSIVYREFSKHLMENEFPVPKSLSSKIIKICCLAGGPGTEAVGIIKAIHDVIWKSDCFEGNSLVDVYITVVDVCSKWTSEVTAVVDGLKSSRDLFPSRKMNFHADFFKADLFQPYSKKLQRLIREADIITIVKFANAIIEKGSKDCIPQLVQMMKNVADHFSDESCVFMLDTAGGNDLYHVADVICKHRGDFIRQTIKHKGYRLHAETMKELEGIMNFRTFAEMSTLFPTQLTRVSSFMWYKNPLIKKEMIAVETGKTMRKSADATVEARKIQLEKLKAEKEERRKIKKEKRKAEKLEMKKIMQGRQETEAVEPGKIETEKYLEARHLKGKNEEDTLEVKQVMREIKEGGKKQKERIKKGVKAVEIGKIMVKSEEATVEARRLELEKLKAEKAERRKIKKQKRKAEKVEMEKLMKEKQEMEKLMKEKQEMERIVKEKQYMEKLMKEKQEMENLMKEKQEVEAILKILLQHFNYYYHYFQYLNSACNNKIKMERIKKEVKAVVIGTVMEGNEEATVEARRLELEKLKAEKVELEKLMKEKQETEAILNVQLQQFNYYYHYFQYLNFTCNSKIYM